MTAGSEGRSLELYFINGKPDGMLTAEVFNWTGHVLMTPRTQITAALARREAKYTGVYLLLGDEEGKSCAYIGESENIADRIKTHDSKLDWWNSAVLVTTSANALHKAHAKYLEARLIEEAKAVGRVALRNGSAPSRPGLSEAAVSNMEAFLDYLLMVLPALRVDMFLQHAKTALPAPIAGEAPVFELVNKKHGLTALARLIDDEFIVEAGSLARLKWEGAGSSDHGYAKLHAELLSTGVLVPDGGRSRFIKHYAFASPSAAAAVVDGRPANGRIEWKVKATGQTYADWEVAQLATPDGGPA